MIAGVGWGRQKKRGGNGHARARRALEVLRGVRSMRARTRRVFVIIIACNVQRRRASVTVKWRGRGEKREKTVRLAGGLAPRARSWTGEGEYDGGVETVAARAAAAAAAASACCFWSGRRRRQRGKRFGRRRTGERTGAPCAAADESLPWECSGLLIITVRRRHRSPFPPVHVQLAPYTHTHTHARAISFAYCIMSCRVRVCVSARVPDVHVRARYSVCVYALCVREWDEDDNRRG